MSKGYGEARRGRPPSFSDSEEDEPTVAAPAAVAAQPKGAGLPAAAVAAAPIAAAPKAPGAGTAAVAAVQGPAVASTGGPTSPMGQPEDIAKDVWDLKFLRL